MKSHLFLNDCFYMCREHVTELTGQDVDFVPPLFFLGGHVLYFCCRACCQASLLGFMLKQICFPE